MVRSSARKATQKGVALAQGCETAEASYDARIWTEWRGGMGGAVRGDGRSGAGVWAEWRGGMDGVAQGHGRSGAGVWAARREGMGKVARGHGRNGAGGWAERRGGMGGAARGDGRGGARVWAEWREEMGGAARGDGRRQQKDAVLKGRTRRLQTLNSVWKGNYCSGIGDGGAIKSTKQREASAVPYRFVMVIPSVMKLSSPK